MFLGNTSTVRPSYFEALGEELTTGVPEMNQQLMLKQSKPPPVPSASHSDSTQEGSNEKLNPNLRKEKEKNS